MPHGSMSDVELSLRLIRRPDGTPVDAGVGALLRQATEIGRAPGSDLVLDDATVSRVHARLDRRDGRWWVENRSANNGVFVDERPVPPGTAAPLSEASGTLQIGGLLFATIPLAATTPYTEPVRADGSITLHSGHAPLRVVRDGDVATVHVGGRLATMKPLASLVLHALAERAGDVVHEWDLLERIGRDAHLPQAVSEIRRAFRRLIDAGDVADELVRGWVRDATAAQPGGDLAELDAAALCRRLVMSRRGHGYALLVPPSVVAVEEAG